MRHRSVATALLLFAIVPTPQCSRVIRSPPMTLGDEIDAIEYAIAHLEAELKVRPPSAERRVAIREVIATLKAMRGNLVKRTRRLH